MVADQQPVPVRGKPDQRKPHQRRRRQIEPLQAVGLAGSPPAAACCSALVAAPTDRSAATAPRPARTTTCTGRLSRSCRKPPAGWRAAPTTRLQRGLAAPRRRARPQAQARAAPYRRPAPAHRTAHGTAAPPAAATAAGCPRSADSGCSSRSISPCVSSTSARSLGCGRRRRAARHAAPAPQAPGTSVSASRAPPPRRAAPAPKSSCAVSRGPSAPSSVSALISMSMRQRHRRIAAADAPHSLAALIGRPAGAQSAPSPPPRTAPDS